MNNLTKHRQLYIERYRQQLHDELDSMGYGHSQKVVTAVTKNKADRSISSLVLMAVASLAIALSIVQLL